MLLGHLLAQILQHGKQLLVGSTTTALRTAMLLLLLLLVVVVVERNGDSKGFFDELFTLFVHRNQAVVLDILVNEAQNLCLAHHGTPEAGIMLFACAKPLRFVVVVALYEGSHLTRKDRNEVIDLELIAQIAQRLQGELELFLGIDLRFRVAAVVAVAAIPFGVLLAEVVQQCLAAAHRTFGIGDCFEQQQLANLLLGNRLAVHEFLEFLDILVAVEGEAVTLATITTGTTRLLIVALERLGNIVVNHIAHVGLVDTHTEGNRSDNNIDTLHEEVILILGACGGIHTGMIGTGFDAVCHQEFGQLLDLLAAEAVDDTALSLVLLDVEDDIVVHVALGANFVVEIRAVERRAEDGCIGHTEVLLDIHLHLGRCGGRQGDERSVTDFVDDGANTAILGAEIVAPLRDTVCLIDGVERYFDFAQEGDIILLRERLGGEVEQFGLSIQHILTHLLHGRLVERRIQKVGDARILGEGTHRIDLILHQGNQGRDNDSHTLHDEGGQLVAERFTSAGRHEDKGVPTGKHVVDDSLLISFEGRKPEVFLQASVQKSRIVAFHFSVL